LILLVSLALPDNPFLGTIALAHDSLNCGLVGPLTAAAAGLLRTERTKPRSLLPLRYRTA
jgi:hypothetical protein